MRKRGLTQGTENGNQQFWSRWSGRYDKFMRGNEPLYDAIAARMVKRLNRRMDVLELACGTGLISQRIVGSVKSLEATDYAPEMIAEARKKAGSVRLHYSVQDATALPYAAESFDAVVIANALHIVPDPEKVLAEIRRVLKLDGLLIAPTFVHGEDLGFRLRTRIMELAGFKSYHKWNAKEFAGFISAHGFAVTEQTVMGSNIAPLCYLEAERNGTRIF